MDHYWIDSHAHVVSDKLIERFDEIKQNALNHNVKKICIICGNLSEIKMALSKVENDTMFDLAIGVHPGSTKEVSQEELNLMMTYLNHPQVKFVGEIGLDYYWDQSFNDHQKQLLIQQIKIANEFDLPVTLHIRESSDDVYEILKKHPVNRKGIAHCYTENFESAKRFVDLGYYIGIGGIVTFKNGDNIRDLVENVPFDRLLSETDSPYLAPIPFRGKSNEPAYVSYVGKKIAELKGLSEEAVQIQLMENYERLTKR